ncbi:MAG: hypothetical protein KDA31_01710 [Phycisphaerales bacterium]|nr:hypothetical protein [Phycisphaerales bacterium]MCB9835093.1 hypothetical protein [Phycisphaera sp.]
MARARAFALVELVVVVAIAGVLLALCLPAIDRNRKQASIRGDAARLRLIGQASAMYAEDFEDRLFTFSWRPDEVPVTPNTQLAAACAQLLGNSGQDDQRAALYQQLDLVTQMSDYRLIQPTITLTPQAHTPYFIYSHLVLAYHMGDGVPSEVFVSHADASRNYWIENTEEYLLDPHGSPYPSPTASPDFRNLWRWPFSSSFSLGPSHFSSDSAPPNTVARSVSHHWSWSMPTTSGVLARRMMTEVAHPSAKVMMYDDYDRYSGATHQYFALPGARTLVSFYDGHAQSVLTESANLGFDPNHPGSGAFPSYFYRPRKQWDPPGALDTLVPIYFDQTRDGLQGVDFPALWHRRPIPSE